MHIQNETQTQSDYPDRGFFFAAIQCREIPEPECQVPRPRRQCRQPVKPNAEYYEDSSMPTSKASGVWGYRDMYMYPNSTNLPMVNTALGFTTDEQKRTKSTNTTYTRNKALGIQENDYGKH
jgi:hypothetical protein